MTLHQSLRSKKPRERADAYIACSSWAFGVLKWMLGFGNVERVWEAGSWKTLVDLGTLTGS